MELLFGLSLGAAALFIFWRSWKTSPEILDDLKDVPLDPDGLRSHAAEIAKAHGASTGRRVASSLLKRLEANYARLFFVYRYLNAKAGENQPLSPASEWILDNYYLIEEQGKETRQRLACERFVKMPVLQKGYLKGYPRVYAISLELISHTDGRLDSRELTDFMQAYQEHRVLSMAEIGAVSLMVKIALVEYLRHLADKIYETEIQWDRAAQVMQLPEERRQAAVRDYLEHQGDGNRSSFVEHLAKELRKSDEKAGTLSNWLGQLLLDLDISLEQLIEQEHFEQAARKISAGHAIVSLKTVSRLNWEEIFDALSRVERILGHDPHHTYAAMDTDSRFYYRRQVELLAAQCRIPETRVARMAVGLAKEAGAEPPRTQHVGYYLIGAGRRQLVAHLGGRPGLAYFHNYPPGYYFGALLLLLALQLIPLGLYAYEVSGGRAAAAVLAVLLLLWPAADVAIFLVNRWALRLVPPTRLPKLAFKAGIPPEAATMVVIPSLLPGVKQVEELVGRLEVYYLANREANLYFTLAGDFKDGAAPSDPQDAEIMQAGLAGVAALNQKYGAGRELFFYCQRQRKLCPTQGRWTGWERKRGALVEFNRLLMGAGDTTYTTVSPGMDQLAGAITYVITLDADTRLTLDVAKQLIGTMAHPLNQAVVDQERGVVTEGYGLVQPRIGVGITSAHQSVFTRLFAGEGGIDPYTTAVSDIYQDLFSEGIFTGKGIYDLKVFHALLTEAIPEASVLSHDLLEGSYLRTGLATDVELVDGYPGTYSSFAARQHRWTRGDWQLLPWLLTANPLSSISKWKIFDNLRRSLLPAGQWLLLVAGLIWLPGNPLIWLTWAILPLALPVLSHFLTALASPQPAYSLDGLRDAFYRGLLLLAFLPHQGWLMGDAAVRTLYRVLFSRKLLLEWVTAADVEKSLKHDFSGLRRRMRAAPTLALLALVAVGIARPSHWGYLLPLAFLWLASPRLAFRISQKEEGAWENLSAADQQTIRRLARRTWAYYEDFVNEENNYLPPDNYQVDPPNGLAPRTSPTNIGFLLLSTAAARDFGYLTTTDFIARIKNTLATMEKMEVWRGHLFNWYHTKTLEPLRPFFISTVDSGNLAGYLLVAEYAVQDYCERPLWGQEMLAGLRDTYRLAFPETDNWSEEDGAWNLSALRAIVKKLKERSPADEGWSLRLKEMVRKLEEETQALLPRPEILAELKMQGESTAAREITSLLQALEDLPSLRDVIGIYQQLQAILPSLDFAVREACETEIARVLAGAENLLAAGQSAAARLQEFFAAMDFTPLYDEEHDLFAIGYNKEEEKITNSHYDLLASEARLISYLAICKGEVPPRHWFKLGRALSQVGSHQGLVSWTGTMFEYLMPPLVMKDFPHTLLAQTYETLLLAQVEYGKMRAVPWGTSESGYYAFDFQLNYQYRAFGVPDLGLKRGLVEDMVVSPYSTLLALPFAPQEAMDNLHRLLRDGLEGEYGLYEAVDYTRNRLPQGETRQVVASFMAHHLGMSLVAMGNFLHGQNMQERFHRHPLVKSGEILLEERLPARVIVTKDYKETVRPFGDSKIETVDLVRTFELDRERGLPHCQLLSNGRYTALLTNEGSGFSRREGVQLTRWRGESLNGNYGFFIFVKAQGTERIWSATAAPFPAEPDHYLATFSLDKATFTRVDDLIATHTEVVVAPEDDVEIRQMVIGNNGPEAVILEVTSYGEIVLGDQNADLSHPAFSNLFIKTEALPEEDLLLASRRPRALHQETHWAFHSLWVTGESMGHLQFETNRGNFLGRQRALARAAALSKPLSGTVGTVLDPIFSLRCRVRVPPNQTVTLSWLLGYGSDREQALALARKYRNEEAIGRAFAMAKTRSQVETHFFNLTEEEIALYQDLMAHLLFPSPLRVKRREAIANNRKGQSGLWAYGISGDRPLVMVTVAAKEGIEVVKELVKAHEYWRTKGLSVDLLILNEDKSQYLQPLQELLRETIVTGHSKHLLDTPGGIFLRHGQSMPAEDRNLFYTVAKLVLDSHQPLYAQLKWENREAPPLKVFPAAIPCYEEREEPVDLQLWNGFGGFNRDGDEYVIRLREGVTTPAPWINVVTNRHFGFQVSESGAGFTWAENSRENKLTPWSNDPVADPAGEVIYLRDEANGAVWNMTPGPKREVSTYTVHHGLGYTRFYHHSHALEQEQILYVPPEDPVKLSLLRLTNTDEQERQLSIFYYARPVLGVNEEVTAPFLVTDFDTDQQILQVQNHYHRDFPRRVVFMAASEEVEAYTGDRREFLGPGGDLAAPAALAREGLSQRVGAGLDPCLVLQLRISLPPGQTKELVLLLGQAQEGEQARDLVRAYRDLSRARQALADVRRYWQKTLSVVQIKTPDLTMDLLMNKWLMYQNIACRLWARSAFYQSGGAFGYRDQLQDSLNAIYIDPDITREQLLLHAAYQFKEGDVLHWWHPGVGDRGVRTRFTDDRLWLPFVLVEYLARTGDDSILDEEISFLEGESLAAGEDEKYFTPTRSQEEGTLYEHCLRALNISLQFGEHGLPLMGSGDWNDGMSTVGNLGRGESCWLGWFLYHILQQFAPLCERRGDVQEARYYEEMAQHLGQALEESGWDGGWYRRAYFDDGTPLGSAMNDECSIDSLSQSWAVIAGGQRRDRAETALNAVARYLIDRELGVIKLFAPPFEEGDLEPGYIKGYVAGVRENGAQYTHAATWVIQAFAMLGRGDQAWELFHMINPLNHARTPIACAAYKVEPYVAPADVYTVSPQEGRGGWTWYTGAAGWMYRVALENMLGFTIRDGKLWINPCIPRDWPGFQLDYRYGETLYQIEVTNPDRVNRGVQAITVNEKAAETGIPLVDDGITRQIRVTLSGAPATVCVLEESSP